MKDSETAHTPALKPELYCKNDDSNDDCGSEITKNRVNIVRNRMINAKAGSDLTVKSVKSPGLSYQYP